MGPAPVLLIDRFWTRVNKFGVISPILGTMCWEWLGHIDKRSGYGTINLSRIECSDENKRGRLVHRVSYELCVGLIPEGLTLDHLCRNRCCVNPEHLEPVTLVENVMRGECLNARRARQTHCLNGHALTGYNLIIKKHGHRNCRTCHNAKQLIRNKNRRNNRNVK